MDRRDYIMRIIEQMGAVFARLRNIIARGQTGVEDELRLAARQGSVDLTMARALDAESLLGLLSAEGMPDPTRVWIYAELLAADGMAAEYRGRPEEALRLYQKALRLFLVLDPRVIGGIPEAADRIRDLELRINGASGTPPSAA